MNARQTLASQSYGITPGALAALEETTYTPQLLLSRHFACDWSELEPEDIAANRAAIAYGLRVMSVYTIEEIKFWVITEADRNLTTILLPSEY